MTTAAARHPFLTRPHRTLTALSLPIMASLVVEPLAGVVDTAFVERLGPVYASALGAATALFAAVIWIFNFLGIGAQTQVAHALGRGAAATARQTASLAMVLSVLMGSLLAVTLWAGLDIAARWMSGDPVVQQATITYLRIRLLGAPAGLVVYSAFGALRGQQDMRTPLWIAGGLSLLNVLLDPLLIFGPGPLPRLGIAGAAWATAASQIAGAAVAVTVIGRRLGLTLSLPWERTRSLLVVGRDMIVRTGLLLFFLLMATRSALQIGVESGAAHQAIRQVWMLMAFVLDAFASAAQSLSGYFLGAHAIESARRVARVSVVWALGTGTALMLGLLVTQPLAATLLVPPSARAVFSGAWVICAVAQPLNALSFLTDGLHWGSGDFAYLRNAMVVATLTGLVALAAIDPASPGALHLVWWVTALWIAVRAAFGTLRIWPGTARSPLRAR